MAQWVEVPVSKPKDILVPRTHKGGSIYKTRESSECYLLASAGTKHAGRTQTNMQAKNPNT